MYRSLVFLFPTVFLSMPAWGQPRQWNDDFRTAATYDSTSLYAPCYGGTSTKYTVFEGLTGDIYNERAIGGNGMLKMSNRQRIGLAGNPRFEFGAIGVLDVGQICPDNPDPNPGASLISSEPFTGSAVCIYAGIAYDRWQIRTNPVNGYGADGKPGFAGKDDDLDGVTDDEDESPSRRSIGGGGYGPPFPDGGVPGNPGGSDGRPGIAGVDDDADGIIDEFDETGLGNDPDDNVGRLFWACVMKLNPDSTSGIYINFDPGSIGTHLFSLEHLVQGVDIDIEGADEIHSGFYRANTRYHYAFCANGTCFGAQLWTGSDLANPNETLGPAVSTSHAGPQDNIVAFVTSADVPIFEREMKWLTNGSFSDRYWVVSGNPSQYYPSPSADLDADKDVDGFDFLTFSNCYNGSNKPAQAACTNSHADLDKDGDVDGFDFLTFSNCYNGSNKRPQAACFPPDLTTCGS